jgi:hypothetical protein
MVRRATDSVRPVEADPRRRVRPPPFAADRLEPRERKPVRLWRGGTRVPAAR